MPVRRVAILVLCCLLASTVAQAAAEKQETPCKPVAKVLGKPICPVGPHGLLEKLLASLYDEYAKRKKLQPTGSEVEHLSKVFADLRAATASAESSNEIEVQFIRAIILYWKVGGDLHRQYGGRVRLSSFGFHVPVDAVQVFLKEEERRGSFEIYDAPLKQAFWQDLKEGPGDGMVEEKEGRQIFAITPWETARNTMASEAAQAEAWKRQEEAQQDLKKKVRESLRKKGREVERLVISPANPGELLLGQVIYESEDEIVVDVQPCDLHLYHLHKPYVKVSNRGTEKCGDQEFEIFVVQQN